MQTPVPPKQIRVVDLGEILALAEMEHLKRFRGEIMDGHLSVGHVGGGNGPGGGGIEPRDVFAMNKAIDKASDGAELECRIERLQTELGESPDVGEPG